MRKAVIVVVLLCMAMLVMGQKSGSDSGSPDSIGNADDIVGQGAADNENSTDKGKDDATGNDVNATGNDANKIENKGDEQQLLVQERQQTQEEAQQMMEQRREEVRQQIQQRKMEMDAEANQGTGNQQTMQRNQNQVRLAVHALLAMENLTGGIGPQVREVARNFNNSIMSTMRSEGKMVNRSGISRFFAGGDHKAATEIESEVVKNKEKINELKQLREECDCDEEVKAMMQEQIQAMDTEQTRLSGLAAKEKKSKGIIGWLWK